MDSQPVKILPPTEATEVNTATPSAPPSDFSPTDLTLPPPSYQEVMKSYHNIT